MRKPATKPVRLRLFDRNGQKQHVKVRYRLNPPSNSRVFIANSSKSVDAVVTAVTQGGIGFITNAFIAPATPVRIEIGDSGAVPYLDLAAQVTCALQEEDGRWRYACTWTRNLTPEELLVSRHRAFQAPHWGP